MTAVIKIGVSFVLVLVCISDLTAQTSFYNLSTSNKKARELYMQADEYYMRRDYVSAIDLMEKALDKDRNFVEAIFRIGNSYYRLGEDQKAEDYWIRAWAVANDDPGHAYILYYLGTLMYQSGEYRQSVDYLDRYFSFNTGNARQKEIAGDVLRSARFGVESMEKDLQFNPRPLPEEVNRFQLQYFPVMPVDQSGIIYTRRVGLDPSNDEDIFIVPRDSDGNWMAPQSISEKINTDFNEGTCAISADGRTLIFTSCYGRQNFGSCDLFITYRSGDEWSQPENLGPAINSGAWESQPSLSADGRTLYFVSDRNGGYGLRDVWVSRRNRSGEWVQAINLGPNINTALDEVSPFIHPNNQTLYFASKGHVGLGGFDIFFSEKYGEQEKWSEPTNIGYPLNTKDDQVSLFITADGAQGFYSFETIDLTTASKRSLIYQFDVPKELQVTYKSSFVKGHVFDSKTKQTLKAAIELVNLEADMSLLQVHSDSISGEYLMVITEGSEYGLFISKPGYLFKSLTFDLKDSEVGAPVEIDIFLDPVSVGASVTLNNIFFAHNEFELDPKSEPELKKVLEFLAENQDIRIMVEGHTDNTGEESYNLQLSEKRARSVFDFLTSKGVDNERVKYVGLGMSQPVADNDSEANRARNRRIEFRVLE